MDFLRKRFSSVFRATERYAGTDLKYLAESGFWMNISSVAISLFSLGLYIVFANFLSRDTYGIYQYFLSASAIIGTLTLTGMNSAVTRAVASGKDGTLVRAVKFQLQAGVLPFAVGLAGSVYYVVAGNLAFASAFFLIGLLMPLANAFNTYSAYLLGKKSFARMTLYTLLQYAPYYGLLALTAFVFPDAIALLFVNLVATALASFLIYTRIVKKDQPQEPADADSLRYGTHLSVMNAFPSVAAQLDAIMAFQFLGPAGLAVYAFSTAIPDRLGSLFKFFPVAALPKFAERTDDEIRRSIAPKLLKLGALAIVFAGVYALIVPFFFRVFFPAYMDAVPYSQLYSLALVLIVANVASAALTAKARTKALYAANVITTVLGLVIQFAGIALFGLIGLVIAKVASAFLASLVFTLILLRKPTPVVSRP